MLAVMLAVSVWAQSAPVRTPRFEDYPVPESWGGSPAPVVITTRAERMFRTRLTTAAKGPPNFAGHYRVEIWGCGSECISGAIVDLETGKVFSPPLPSGSTGLCTSAFAKAHLNTRGWNSA
jgi:hypothetical protein